MAINGFIKPTDMFLGHYSQNKNLLDGARESSISI